MAPLQLNLKSFNLSPLDLSIPEFPDLTDDFINLKMKLPAPLKELISLVIGDQCYTTLVEELKVTNIKCLKYSISKCLGLGIVIFGSIVKIPQIIKIIKSNSTMGISLASYLLETMAYFITICYNIRSGFSFTTWGETLFICFQNLFILCLMQFYSQKLINIPLLLIASTIIYKCLINDAIIDENLISILQTLTIPLTLVSRIPQIIKNYNNKNTGQLSSFTIFSYMLGTGARIFTTVQEVQDKIILMGFLLAFSLNSILALQMVYYWDSKPHKKVTQKRKAKSKKLD